nr:hypothetical protein [Pseudomonadota bacterium]
MARETPQNHLLLYFHEELSDDPVCLAWLERSPTSCVEVALSEISLVFTRLDSCDVSCVIAGHSVPGKRMRVPIKAASKIEKSLAWMMEEELAVALDKVHLTHTRRNDTEVGEAVFLILSAEHHYLRAWLDTLARYRIHPQRLVPIHALIPESSTGAGLRLNDQLAYSDHNSCGLFDADSPPGVELLDSGVCEIAVDVDEFHDAVTPTTKAAILSLAGTDTTSDDNAPDSPVDDQGESPAPANAGADGADDDPNKSHRPVSDGADGADGELGEGRALASAGADGELGEGRALASAGADG